MPKIDFLIGYQHDLELTLQRLISSDPAGKEKRLKEKEIKPQIIKELSKLQSRKEKLRIVDNLLQAYYQKHKEQMKKVREELEKWWKKREQDFFALVSEKMGKIPWKHESYHFLVTAFFSSSQWGGGNELSIWWKRSNRPYICGFELILCHFFEIVDRLYSKRPVSDWHLWALAESMAYILIYKDREITEKFWPGMKEPGKFGYPQLIPIIQKVEASYFNYQDFKKFISQAIEFIRQQPLESLIKPKH